MLSKEELKKYSRQIILPELGIEGQEKLKNAKVIVIGAGGLGCPVLQYLSAAGIGTIGIADFDVVDESNLHRQILFGVKDICKPKAEIAVNKLSEINPLTKINVYSTRLDVDNALEIIKEYNIVVDGSDNFSTKYLLNDACVILNKPLVLGSIFKFDGQVSVFNYNNGPTYRCLYPEPPSPEEVPNCSEIGVIGVLPGLVGCLQANEVIKIITGIGKVLSGKLVIFNLLKMDFSTIDFQRNHEAAQVKKLQANYDFFCSPDDKTTVQSISVFTLKNKLDSNENIQLVDVREPHEHYVCNIGGLLIPLQSIEKNFEKIDKNKEVIVYCRTGSRSADAVKLLEEKYNFKNIYNLQGGIIKWAEEFNKATTRY